MQTNHQQHMLNKRPKAMVDKTTFGETQITAKTLKRGDAGITAARGTAVWPPVFSPRQLRGWSTQGKRFRVGFRQL